MKMQPKKVVEVEDEGLLALLGEQVTFFCLNYIYTGKLVGVNDTCVKLESPQIVYETGSFSDSNWKDAQHLGTDEFYISTTCIESFGVMK